MRIFSFLACIAFLSMAGCRATKKISTSLPKKDTAITVVITDRHADSMLFVHDVLNAVEKNRIDYETFSAKMKVEYWDKDGKGPDLTVFVRMKKDSLIWLSVNATVFSYEAFRILITPDSVKLVNKKDKVVQLRSVKYLEEMAKLPFDFQNFQNVLVGNPIFLDDNVVSYKQTANALTLFIVGDLFKNLVTLSNDGYAVQHIKLDDIDEKRNRTCDLSYDNYTTVDGRRFATGRRISLAEKTKIDVQMDYKQFGFNESLAYPFTIPKNYKLQ